MESKVDLEKMRSEGGKVGAGAGVGVRESGWQRARLHFAFGVACPQGLGGGVV